ncbi:MAG: carbohydrate ABC transporter permease [Clostridiales bacterium]|jgi:raffinose/stachyose/melibiose transport system permease protein|nr:carbohydrate ABC transporter permease [Clostridiales bacterium]
MISKIGRQAAILFICALCLTPFYILLTLSLNKPTRILSEGNIFIPDFHFHNYIDGWVKSQIGTAILNSALITLFALAVIVVLGTMAAYTIARFDYKFNKAFFWIFLCSMMIPGIINTVPLYTLMIRINAINTLWGMALVCATNVLPSSVFIFTGFVRSLPREIEESAIIDGCSWFAAFWRITFPLLKPSIAAVAILNGFGIWNNYAQAVFFLQDRSKHNIPQALSVYFQQFAGAKWHLMAATAVIAVIPVICAFLLFQKSLLKGLTEGAVKG